jgi:DNA-binding PadR family transcriptional regulator
VPAPAILPIATAVLTWLAVHRVATERQVLLRFWGLRGRSAGHGYRVLRRLVSEGLVERDLLDPALGRRSQAYLSLTHAGWQQVALARPSGRRPPLNLLLDWAQVALFRGATGWELVPPRDVWRLLTKATMTAICRKLGRRGTGQYRNLIEHKADPTLGLWALRHRRSGAIRLLVPARSIMGLGRVCRRVSSSLYYHAEFMPIQIELIVGPVPPASAERFLERWFGGYRYDSRRRNRLLRPRRRMRITIHHVRAAADLPHPLHGPHPTRNVYARHGSPDPLLSPASLAWMISRGNGPV